MHQDTCLTPSSEGDSIVPVIIYAWGRQGRWLVRQVTSSIQTHWSIWLVCKNIINLVEKIYVEIKFWKCTYKFLLTRVYFLKHHHRPVLTIRLFRIISILSKKNYFRLPDHVISMECKALDFQCQCTQQKLQSICAVLTFDPQLKNILTFSVKDNISIRLFYLYQRLQCRDNYFFKINFVFFLYLLLSASWKENVLPLYISDIRQIVGYRTPVFIQPFPWRLHITITYNRPHLRLWYADVVTVIA
jgi:hypothetical protein